MYADESVIQEPPQDGWPTISPNGWPEFDKTDKVIDLLRHLPYISGFTQIAPDCDLVSWHTCRGDEDGVDFHEVSEPFEDEAKIPSHIVGLTLQGTHGLTFLLDTELGVIYWYECDSKAKVEIPEVHPDPYGWMDDGLISEDQADWRAGSGVWEISDFFEMLKANFRTLNFVPFHHDDVKAAYYSCGNDGRETLEEVQKIYKDHGWPDLTRYRKRDCLAAVEAYLKTRYLALERKPIVRSATIRPLLLVTQYDAANSF
ncbi:hypothetical protein AA0113_g5865 [Alternaria arborescens]|uniref:Uncharacterized protein n=1 Tax=Alternaria arborescens TaxID=156630 RepID=A0A4Q4S4N0_9PLEO|nr:hypothetical protein AA0111_g2794 [Alternaria arborescens]RYN29170.1 hypothetical protein AA0112_g7298 [Alternaria arborescens]RYO36226.1 hypothetical protein AA0111_g2794 [Alternaria arborescens]RYO64897.1 hypothetical protein AA0113_g5865 [Alternaria arborescens]